MSEFVDLIHPSSNIVDLAFSDAAPVVVKIEGAFFPLSSNKQYEVEVIFRSGSVRQQTRVRNGSRVFVLFLLVVVFH